MSTTPPTPFTIVADVRTGSTLLSSTLNQHPQIRCRGELFHPQDFPDNQVPGGPRHALPATDLIGRALADDHARAVGFRAMVFHPEPSAQPQWSGAWSVLAAQPDLRAIFLQRRDALAQFASLAIAQQTGRFNPSPEDPLFEADRRPRVRIDPADLRQWIDERGRLYARRRAQLRGCPVLDLDYEELTDEWDGTIARIEDFLGVERRTLSPAKQKQEKRPLSESVENYRELQGIRADHRPNREEPQNGHEMNTK